MNQELFNAIDIYQKIFFNFQEEPGSNLLENIKKIELIKSKLNIDTIKYLNSIISNKNFKSYNNLEKTLIILTRDIILEYHIFLNTYQDLFSLVFKQNNLQIKNPSTKKKISANYFVKLLQDPNYEFPQELLKNYNKSQGKLIPIYINLLNQLCHFSQIAGFESYLHLMKQTHYCNYDKLYEKSFQILNSSCKEYKSKLEQLSTKYLQKKYEELSNIDIIKIISGFWLRKNELPMKKIISIFNDTCESLGFKFLKNQNIVVDLDISSKKSLRSYCMMPTGKANEKIILIINPNFNYVNLSIFFHEGGHAIHFSNIDFELPPLFRTIGDFAITESISSLFEKLLCNPIFLENKIGLEKSDAQDLSLFYNFLEIYKARKNALNYIYLYELLKKKNFTKELMDESQKSINLMFHKYFGFNRKCYDFLSFIGEKPLMIANYIRAEEAGRVIERKLISNFGVNWWDQNQAGSFLMNKWLKYGFSKSFDELILNFKKI